MRVLDFIKSGGLEEGRARNGMVIRGAGGPRSNGRIGDGTIRVGARVPWGADVEFAYTTGYDSHGRVSVNRLVDERDCAVMLTKPDPDGAGPVLPGTGA